MKLIYTVEINEEICGLDALFEALDGTVEAVIGCVVIKSRLESPDEIYDNDDLGLYNYNEEEKEDE